MVRNSIINYKHLDIFFVVYGEFLTGNLINNNLCINVNDKMVILFNLKNCGGNNYVLGINFKCI